MDFYESACVICFIYASLYFFDVFLKSCSHYPYLYFLESTGLKIGIFKIQWYTTVLNRYFHRSVRWKPKFMRRWFSFGVWVTITLLPLAMYLVISTAVSNMTNKHQSSTSPSKLVLEPMIPGVNLPLNDMSYYIVAIAVSSVVHEAGHALAAVREGVHVSGFGIFIMVVLPSAYVLLNSSQLEALPPYRSLRILTAGVWHNVVLAALATLAVFITPHVLNPLFSQGKGLFTVDLPENSPFRGPTGLNPGDLITKVNGNCNVRNKADWKNCISMAISEVDTGSGFCLSSNLLSEDSVVENIDLNSDPTDCCSRFDKAGYLCFGLSFPSDTKKEGKEHKLTKSNHCLPARKVIEHSGIPCKTYLSCPNTSPLCARPFLSNHTSLFVIERESRSTFLPKSVIFLGHPSEAWWSIKVSDFVPHFRFIPLSASALPEAVVHQLKYLAVLSLGLALINVLPFFMFDGQHIITALLRYLLESYVSPYVSDKIAKYVIVIGSLSLGACLLSSLLKL